VDNAHDPLTDVAYDSQGVLSLTGNKPQLRDGLRAYFALATRIPWNLQSRTWWGSLSLNKHSHYSDPAETLPGQAVK
jgi:hypothetical protein